MVTSSATVGALNAGYHVAFVVGATFAAAAAVLGALLLRPKTVPRHDEAATASAELAPASSGESTSC